MEDIIIFLIQYGPLILFVLTLLLSVLFGFLDGKRKSIIFLVHSIISLVICVSLYYGLINNEYTDSFILSLINFFLGSSTGLQNLLHVSVEHTTLSSCLLEWLPNSLNFNDSFKLLLSENTSYLLAIVDLLYHIAFFIVLFVLFWILKFILWLTYIFFYSDRKYKVRNQYEIYANNDDTLFRKKRIQGSLIGLFRGFVSGICTLSIIGSVFFIATGGPNAEKISDIKLSQNTNELVKYYGYIEEYGNTGILGFMNGIKDNEGTPYYLMLTDIVLQGSVKDENNNVTQKLYLRKELGEYVYLAKKTINLVDKYSDASMEDITSNKTNINSIIVPLLVNDGFKEEFKQLILGFDNEMFALQFGLGLLESAISNIDTISFTNNLNPMVKDLVQIMFKKGYYSDSIPEEKHEKETNEEKLDVLPYFKLKNFLSKSDFCEIYEMIVEIIKEEKKDAIQIVESVLPRITNLSIFKKDSLSVSPVLGRLYNFAACNFLKNGEREEIDSFDIYKYNITDTNWVEEIHLLSECSSNIFGLYRNVYEKDVDIITTILKVFDESSMKYYENIQYYDQIVKSLSKSRLLGEVLKSKLVSTYLYDSLSKTSTSFEMPEGIEYANTYDDMGNIIKEGEISNLLKGLRAIAENKELSSCIQDLLKGNSIDLIEFLNTNVNSFSEIDKYGKSIFDYLIDSDLLESLISGILIDNSKAESGLLYIPSSALVSGKNNVKKNIILRSELSTLFKNLPTLLDLMEKAKDVSGLDEIINDPTYDMILNNRIVQGTIGRVINKQFENNENLIIPKELRNPDKWVSSSLEQGELKSLINFIRSSGLSISSLTNGESNVSEELFEIAKKEELLEMMLSSKIIHYTVSNVFESNLNIGDLEIIVPNSIKEQLVNDNLEYLIKKDEIKNVFKLINKLELNTLDFEDIPSLLRTMIINKESICSSDIIETTIINYMVNSEIVDYFDVPTLLNNSNDGSKVALKEFDETNAWNKEFKSLLIALDELFDISSPNSDFILDEQYLDDKFTSLVKSGLKKPSSVDNRRQVIDVCFDSMMISNTITIKIDEYIDNELLRNNDVRNSCKINGIYKLSEVRALLDSFDALKISFDETSSYNFMENLYDLNEILSSGKTKLDVIYDSTILTGIITEEIQDIISLSTYLVDHDKAYRNDIDLYRKEELKALIDIVGNNEFTYEFNINSISLSKIRNSMFVGDSYNVNSYLLFSAVSKNICKVNQIVIPYSSVNTTLPDGTILLKEKDVFDLFNGLRALNIESINGINFTDLIVNSNSIDLLSRSEILRTTVGQKIIIKNNGVEVGLIAKNDRSIALKTKDINDKDIVQISESEMIKLLNSFFLIIESDSYQITQPIEFNMNLVISLSNNTNSFSEILKSNIINIVISNVITSAKVSNGWIFIDDPKESYEVIFFRGLYNRELYVYTYEEIMNIIKNISL